MSLLQKTETLLVQIGNTRDEPRGAVNTPIYLSAPCRHKEIGLMNGYNSIRTGNPTRDVLEDVIARLEKGDPQIADLAQAFDSLDGFASLEKGGSLC
ncbi:PLP-dependent transferase [Siminovitchia sp. 179-K 8D1 HS]|uniref:PLP-dependent transferase n=1 Tax=Siminovitchia sp. 179-K 8D1 HS TaxID=3142385 RepID=UPI0039A04CE8